MTPEVQVLEAEKPTTEALMPAAQALAIDAPLPLFTGTQMAKALLAYRDLQRALDTSMPEQIMQLDGKPFRKKGYWRAIAVAFGLTVEPVAERREVNGQFADGRDNFGYIVDYRATAPNGRFVRADGSCFAVEKARRFKCPHQHPKGWKGKTEHWPANTCPDFDSEFQWRTLPAEATEHNVRGHAHTRAFNRAVSNLVGFGEVSAEEVQRDDFRHDEPPATSGAPAPGPDEQEPRQPRVVPDAPANGAGQEVKTNVVSVSKKTGTSPKGPWVRYAVKGADGYFYTTFDQAKAETAKQAKEHGDTVSIWYSTNQFGRDLMSIDIVMPFERQPGDEDNTPIF